MKKLLILAALITAPLAAHAQTATPQQVEVSIAGLDLSNPDDAAMLIRRIEAAVRPICVVPSAASRTTAGCIRAFTRDAVENLRIPQLTLAFERRSTHSRAVSRG